MITKETPDRRESNSVLFRKLFVPWIIRTGYLRIRLLCKVVTIGDSAVHVNEELAILIHGQRRRAIEGE